MGVVFLMLLAVGAVIAYPGEPIAWVFAAIIFLGAGGLVYGRWLEIRSQQAMIDLEKRGRR